MVRAQGTYVALLTGAACISINPKGSKSRRTFQFELDKIKYMYDLHTQPTVNTAKMDGDFSHCIQCTCMSFV